MSFKEFKDSFLRDVLDLLWGQWRIIGLAGQAKQSGPYCIDPEALILATCSFGRYDQRLFDGMLEWLVEHERFISLLRTSTLIKKELLEGEHVLRATASFLASENRSVRWRKLAGEPALAIGPEALFIQESESPVGDFGYRDPIFLSYGFSRGEIDKRDVLGPALLSHPASLWLRLRALMGVSSRSDAFLYILVRKDGGHPSMIARELGYTQRGIDQALASMAESGWVNRTESLREVCYAASDSIREALFSSFGGHKPKWRAWTPFYRTLETIWEILKDPIVLKMNIEGQSAELRGAMQRAIFSKNPAGIAAHFMELRSKAGEAYVDSLAKAWNALFISLGD